MHKWDVICPPPRGLVRPVRIDPTGRAGPTRGQAAGPRWRRTSHGYFVPADAPRSVEQRILEASVRLPAGGAVTGWAACRMHRAGLLDGLAPDGATELTVLLAQGVAGRLHTQPGVTFTNEPLDAAEIVQRGGVPVTVIERAAFDAAREARDLREAVVVLDMVFAARLTSPERMRAYVEAHRGWRRVDLVRRALALASEHSRSPQETRLRLVWVLDARLPRPLGNVDILDQHRRLLGVADLLDLEAGLVAEFDGADHRSKRRQARDVVKEDAFRRLGLEVTRVTSTDLESTATVASRLCAARGRAAFQPVAERRWVARLATASLEDELQGRDQRAALWSDPLPAIQELRGW